MRQGNTLPHQKTMNNNKPILSVSGLSKVFPGVLALSGVEFELRCGEIHALMGENGAGKSTLIKVLTGVYRRDEGEVIFEGTPIECTSPLHAQQIGISTVYQEVNLVPNLSIAENLFLGRRETNRFSLVNWKQQNSRAAVIMRSFDLDLDVEEQLSSYSVAIQQMVAIARALELDSKILILDEPTSSLTLAETKQLFEQMRRLRQQGHSIIFVTHFLDQVFEISDRITVLRNGTFIGCYETSEMTKPKLISKLLGQEFEKIVELGKRKAIASQQSEAPLLLHADKVAGSNGVKEFTLSFRAGDIIGCAGLLGSGRTELANTLFGIIPLTTGKIEVDGKVAKISSPRDALKKGIGLSPEDRKAQGIIPDLSVRENIILALQARNGWFKVLSVAEQSKIANKFIEMLRIKTPSTEQAIKNLSGGNQQKVIIARWLASDPKFLIFDEPTRGIDVGAKTEIQHLIIELSKRGMAILFISSEIEELARCSSKIAVMHEYSLVGMLDENEINEEDILRAIVERHING